MKAILGMVLAFGLSTICNADPSHVTGDAVARIGTTVMLRQVVDQKLLGADAIKAIQVVLDGPGTGKLTASVLDADCEAELGVESCVFWFDVKDDSRPDKFKDISFGVDVGVAHGEVTTARPYCTRADPNLPCEL